MSEEPRGLINGVSASSGNRVVARFRRSTGVVVAGLCALVLLFYARLWLPDLVLIKRDAFRFFPPLKRYMVERLAAGELPHWFPYESLGRPFIGVPVTGVFHPFTALYFLLPIHDAYRVSVLLSCLLAAVGAFTLGRVLGFSRAGALLAGVAFALSGYVVSLTENIVYLYSICALPIFCAALEKALAERWVWVVSPAVIWATVFLNGDIQTGYYYGFIAMVWTVMRARGFYREAWLRLACAGALAGLLAGIQLGPAAALFVNSERMQAALFHDTALHWSTHPLRLLTVVASPVGGAPPPPDVVRLFLTGEQSATGPSGLWAESLYIGVPVVGLALLGAWARRDLRVLAVLGGLALLLALGRYGGLYEVFYHVMPLWSAFRYPERLMGVVSFTAAMLAGAGVDVLRKGQGRAAPWLGAAALCGGIGVGLRTDLVRMWAASHFGPAADVAHEVILSAAVAFLFSLMAALGVGLVTVAIRRSGLWKEVSLALLVAIVALDLSRANLEAYHTGPVEAAVFTPGLAEAVKRDAGGAGPGHYRLLSIKEGTSLYPERLNQWVDKVGASSVIVRQALDVEHNAEFRIESIKVYLPGHSLGVASLVKLARQKFGLEGYARYNVAYFIGRSSHFDSPRFAQALVAKIPDYDLGLYKNPSPVSPRAYLSRSPEPVASPVELAALLTRSDFLRGEVDVVEAPHAILPGPSKVGSASVEHYAPEEVRVRVETPQPAVLVLLDAYDIGWRATLEGGKAVPILRANGLVRAVVLPAGSHVVTFAYETPLLRAGAGASVAGVVVCLGLILYAGRRLRGGTGSHQPIPDRGGT